MSPRLKLFCLAFSCAIPTIGQAINSDESGDPRRAIGVVETTAYRTQYIGLGTYDTDAVLYEPTSPRSDIALVYSHPNGNNFGEPVGRDMARRGYRVLLVNLHANNPSDDELAPAISRGIKFLRGVSGVRRIVLVGHSGGGHAAAFYANIAANGPAACSGPEKIYPCDKRLVSDLERPDGLVLLDPTLGAFHQMSSIDPAVGTPPRQPTLDMFAARNGFDPTTKSATYSPAFIKLFLAAQAARNARILATARARLAALGSAQSDYADDEPLAIRGMGVNAAGARLYQPDTRLLGHTRLPHLLLGADGVDRTQIIRSVRAPQAPGAGADKSLALMTQNTTLRQFLATSAIRTLPGLAIREDGIDGVDWGSAISSTPANAEGIRIPTLILSMSCHYLLVPGELTFDHLAARDKTFAAVEGATHLFQPCRPGYGDTEGRTFDFVDAWLSKAGRF
jgi:pimeloyl-ACP methyl ester carboxylesterase